MAARPEDWTIVQDDLRGDRVVALLDRHFRGMLENSPEGGTHFLDLDGLRRPDVTFWTVWEGAALLGCGALRELDPNHGEVKSMRTDDEHLGRGVGRRLLGHILSEARTRGYVRVSLETGSSEAFDAALRLYITSGFEPCGPFGDYTENPFSRFFTLEL